MLWFLIVYAHAYIVYVQKTIPYEEKIQFSYKSCSVHVSSEFSIQTLDSRVVT